MKTEELAGGIQIYSSLKSVLTLTFASSLPKNAASLKTSSSTLQLCSASLIRYCFVTGQ